MTWFSSLIASYLVKVVPWDDDFQVMHAIKLDGEAKVGVQHSVDATGGDASVCLRDGDRGAHPAPIQLQQRGGHGHSPKPTTPTHTQCIVMRGFDLSVQHCVSLYCVW